MSAIWRECQLGDVVELKRGYDLPERERRVGHVPIVSSSGISGWHDAAMVKAPGVVTGRYGTLGQVFLINEDFWPLNTTLYVRDFKGNDPRFISYFLRTLDFFAYSDKAAVPGLNRNHLHQAKVVCPPVPAQRRIAEILGSLDDKIELNRRTNETLEAMARTLFRSWFVDFDPVRAKADGRRPHGLDAATAALFPATFEDSPLGPIPKGWTVRSIGEIVNVVGGSTPSTGEPTFWDGDIHFATPKDMASLTSPVLLGTERTITQAGLTRISSGLLPVGTVLMSSRAPIGYLAIAEVPVAVNQGFIAMRCPPEMPSHYVLHWARQNMDEIVAHANGTTFLEISKTNFRPLKALVPDAAVLRAFSAAVEPLFRRMVCNLKASGTLATLRDGLLPKLLSGDVRVA